MLFHPLAVLQRSLFRSTGRKWGKATSSRRQVLRRAHLRVESLEDRVVPSALPPSVSSPVNVSPPELRGSATFNELQPVIAINPLDPDKMVAVFVVHAENAATTSLGGLYSTNGGRSWDIFSIKGPLPDPLRPTNNPQQPFNDFQQVTFPSVAFDRQNNFYVLSTQHAPGYGSGIVVLDKYNFAGPTPKQVPLPNGVGRPLYPATGSKVLYAWATTGNVNADPVFSPTLVVDNTVPSFTDPDTGEQIVNPFAGTIYVAWTTNAAGPSQTSPPPGRFNPNNIQVLASSDGGNTFSTPRQINDSQGPYDGGLRNNSPLRTTSPRMVVGQGTFDNRVIPGQLIVAWNAFTSPPPPDAPFYAIIADRIFDGGSSASNTLAPDNGTLTDAIDPGGGAPHIPGVTRFQLAVPAGVDFTQVGDVDVSIALLHPALDTLQIRLIAPNGTALTLVQNRTDNAGNTRDAGISGANLGTIVNTNVTPNAVFPVGTVFDSQAARSIRDGAFSAPFIGRFRPEVGSLNVFNGITRNAINGLIGGGVWTLEITDFRQGNQGTLINWSLTFRDRLTPDPRGDQIAAVTTVAGDLVPPVQSYPLGGPSVPASPVIGIGPEFSLAMDNTLGSFSPFQGRIYLAYVDRDNQTPGNPADNTDIFLTTLDSWDDGYLVGWNLPVMVNDDWAQFDGYSESYASLSPPVRQGRAQFQPAIAVDNYSGALVVTFYDARQDADRGRLIRVLTYSLDGGITFSPQTFVNTPNAVFDATTFQTVYLDAITDTQSNIFGVRDNMFTYGYRQDVAVLNGRVYPIWSGNLDGGINNGDTRILSRLDVFVGQATIPAGPRVIASTMGEVHEFTIDGVTFNNTFAPDGTRLATAFVVEFDRHVDPSSFGPEDVRVVFRKSNVPANLPGVDLPVASVQPLNSDRFGATRFLVRFDPTEALVQTGTYVGTYSYSVGPNIRDRIRVAVPIGNRLAVGAWMDQDFNALVAEFPNDIYRTPAPVTATQSLFQPPYDPTTLPLIVPGPKVVSTRAVGGTGSVDNLVLNRTVSALDVVFDRDMDQLSFTPDDIVRFVGPAGLIGPRRPFPSTSGALAIPDNTGQPLRATIDIADSFRIADVNVMFNIAHGRVGDLTAWLVAPDGTRVLLFSHVGGTGANFANTELDDSAATRIEDGTAPFAGVFRPTQALSAFNGKDVRGTWTLEILDDTGGVAGQLNNWTLIVTPEFRIEPNPPGTPNAQARRAFRIHFPTQSLPGTYTLVFGPDIRSDRGDAMDTNANAGLDITRGVDPGGRTTSVSYDSPNVPVVIPDNTTVTSTINITDDFVIQDVTVTLNIRHTNDPDLEVTLIDPTGTRVLLFRNVGQTGSRQDFTNTILDDAARTPIQNGSPPFTGRFNPQLPLAQLRNRPVRGTWTLEIKDTAAGNTGTLLSWRLTFKKGDPGTGLGEPVADQATVSFRIFTMDGTNLLSHQVWTPVGPAGIRPDFNQGLNAESAGRINAVAVDPSDPSGNTVYIAAASGGVWKTTNFLTLAATGPAWVPLTDFGPSLGLHIGALAVGGRDGNPTRSLVIAGTGDGNLLNSGTRNNNPADFPSNFVSIGLGFLVSPDGGATWQLYDSTVNVDSNGNYLPLDSPLRDHAFAGTTVYKIVIDPQPTPSGEFIVYAAVSDNTSSGRGGIYRSFNSGKTWQRVLAGQATDVLLDPVSKDATSGQLQFVYAGIRGRGVFFSPNQGGRWDPMPGGIGRPLLQDEAGNPIPIGASGTPNGNQGRIVLAKPAPTGNPLRDLLQQGWLYVLVAQPGGGYGQSGGQVVGLFVTKDFGQNWTQVQIPAFGPFNSQYVIPTNNEAERDYELFGRQTPRGAPFGQGNYDIALAVDPNNPNVLYLGGTREFGPTGFIRIDLTGLHDAYAFYQDHDGHDGAVVIRNPYLAPFFIPPYDPVVTPVINMITDPANPFLVDATVFVTNTVQIVNTGAHVKWIPLDNLGARDHNVMNPFPLEYDGSTTNVHQIVTYRDPLTGQTRMLIANDQGVYSAMVYTATGETNRPKLINIDPRNGRMIMSIGNVADMSLPGGNVQIVNGSRNGNLQIAQMFYGASQPSSLAAAISVVRGMFYGMTLDNGFPQSDSNVLNNGNVTWASLSRAQAAVAPYGSGAGVATDQTGSGTVYQYKWPAYGGRRTDFFQVNNIGRTQGLIQATQPGDVPDPAQWPFTRGLNFAVNPLSGDQIMISSASGRVFMTENQGRFWFVIAQPADVGGSHAEALAFAAPDPNGPGGQFDLNNFLYVGTLAGRIFVTFTGGSGAGGSNAWIDISTGLDGSPVRAIVPNPTPGSFEAYAVTEQGVYHLVSAQEAAANPGNPTFGWQNITGNLFSITMPAFGDPRQTAPRLRFLTSLAVDWRYVLPDNLQAGLNNPPTADERQTHPILYVGGLGGVFRSLDDGRSWHLFPNTQVDGAPQDGGYLPNTIVTDLDLALGNINPTTGRPNQNNSGTDVLLATTFGRGSFAIRVSPIVFPNELIPGVLRLSPTQPPPDGSDSGLDRNDRITNVTRPVIEGMSEQSAFGNTVRIRLFETNNPSVDIGTGQTDAFGRFAVQVNPGVYRNDGTTDGVKVIGVQAIDAAGVRGNIATLTFTLDTIPPAAPRVVGIITDTGRSNSDGITNDRTLFIFGTAEPNTQVRLTLQGVGEIGRVFADASGNWIVDYTGTALADGTYVFTAVAVDLAGNISPVSAPFTVVVDTVVSPLPALDLQAGSDSGVSNTDNITQYSRLVFDGVAEPLAFVEIFDGTTLVDSFTQGTGTTFTRTLDFTEGVHDLTVRTTDVAGNVAVSSVLTVDIRLPRVTIAATDAIASEEGPDPGIFTVTRSGDPVAFDTTQALTVTYTLSGTATNGVDYQALSGTVIIPAGASSTAIVVVPIDDTLVEGTETVTATVQSTAHYVAGVPNSATIDIRDNDVLVSVLADVPDAFEQGRVPGVFKFIRGNDPLLRQLTVFYSLSGTADNGVDYNSLSGSITFPDGVDTVFLQVVPIDDLLVEPDETVMLTITPNPAYEIGVPNTATVTIHDNDVPRIVVQATVTDAVEESGQQGVFTFTRLDDLVLAPVTVYYTVSGTATAGSDYVPLSGSVTIGAGQTTATVNVVPIDDRIVEGIETVIVTIDPSANYRVGTPASATVRILEGDIPLVSVTATSPTAHEEDLVPGVFTITRSLDTVLAPLTVFYSLDGTAIAGLDYQTLTGSVTLPAGATSANVVITPIDDRVAEVDETVILRLTPNPNYVLLPPDSATVVLKDNDQFFFPFNDPTDIIGVGNLQPGSNTKEVILLNTDTRPGKKAILAFDPTNGQVVVRYNHPTGNFAGWVDPSDRTLFGDVDGDGVAEMIQFNRPASSGAPLTGPAIRIVDIVTGATKKLIRYEDPVGNTTYAQVLAGLVDPEDVVLVGRFTQDRRVAGTHLEALFFNRTSLEDGKIALRTLDLVTGQVTFTSLHDGNIFGGWVDPADEYVVFDSNNDGFEDLAIVNRVPNPQDFRTTDKGFVGLVSIHTLPGAERFMPYRGFYRFFAWNAGDPDVFPGYDELDDHATGGIVINNSISVPVMLLVNSSSRVQAAYAVLEPLPLTPGVPDAFRIISTVFHNPSNAGSFDPDDTFMMADFDGDGVDEVASYNRSDPPFFRVFHAMFGFLISQIPPGAGGTAGFSAVRDPVAAAVAAGDPLLFGHQDEDVTAALSEAREARSEAPNALAADTSGQNEHVSGLGAPKKSKRLFRTEALDALFSDETLFPGLVPMLEV